VFWKRHHSLLPKQQSGTGCHKLPALVSPCAETRNRLKTALCQSQHVWPAASLEIALASEVSNE
jgi:hypothetical protein